MRVLKNCVLERESEREREREFKREMKKIPL